MDNPLLVIPPAWFYGLLRSLSVVMAGLGALLSHGWARGTPESLLKGHCTEDLNKFYILYQVILKIFNSN